MDAVIESLMIALGFFYKALWPILLGVLITALVETLVDEQKMAQVLGRPLIEGAVSNSPEMPA